MKIKMKISSPDDSSDFYTTSFLFRTNQKTTRRTRGYNQNQFGEFVHRCQPRMSDSTSIDPIISSLQNIVDNEILPKKSRSNYRYDSTTAQKNSTSVFTWKFTDGNFSIVYQKTNSQFFINGIKLNKADIITIISKLIYKSCFTRNSIELYIYLNHLIIVPPNVMYCVENRTPYSFWDIRPEQMRAKNRVRGKKYSVTLHTQIISDTECALEISENIWATIKIKELNQFINYHKFDRQRSKRWALSPEKLWYSLFKEKASYSQTNLMYSFLQQNRTQDRVEKRAQQLLVDLTKEHPNKIYKFNSWDARTDAKIINSNALLVKGVLCDWILIPNNSRTNHQKVNAYKIMGVYDNAKGLTHLWKNSFSGGVEPLSIFPNTTEKPTSIIAMTGPICIDTLHGNSSEGDQMASRALALMNDELTGKYIKTLKPYLTPTETRFSDDDLNDLQRYGARFNSIKSLSRVSRINGTQTHQEEYPMEDI